MSIDYDYMAMILSNLSGIPVRLYREEVFQALYYPNNFKPDLAILEEENIFRSSSATVSYYLTEQFLLFGLFRVRREPVSFILGPVAVMTPDRNRVRDILRSIGEPMSRDTELLNYLRATPAYPLRSFLQILCAFDHFINGEKKSVGDLILEDVPVPASPAEGRIRERDEDGALHNTYGLEKQMLSDVEYGRSDSIRAMMRAPAQGRRARSPTMPCASRKTYWCVLPPLFPGPPSGEVCPLKMPLPSATSTSKSPSCWTTMPPSCVSRPGWCWTLLRKWSGCALSRAAAR